jgi:hypothetical protein
VRDMLDKGACLLRAWAPCVPDVEMF